MNLRPLLYLAGVLLMSLAPAAPAPAFSSHPPLRPLQAPSNRPLAEGPARFVDAAKGNDAADGAEATPWRTLNHAMLQLTPGTTLYLRGGTYYEQVYCAVAGLPDAPITIRAYPGELATIDGGLPEFQDNPAAAWLPFPEGAPGEYISARAYRNLRDVTGLFGDGMVGLQTYWYAMDMRATNELWIADPELMIKPLYCGPGLWYDKVNGRIHARLAHTAMKLPEGSRYQPVNYAGETDPRQLPLIVAPFDSVPLRVSQAMHVRFQDLVIRGGGYVTVDLAFGVNLTFDNCTIYCGAYGIWSKNTGPLTMTHCSVYGNIAPWNWRSDNALYSYDGRVYPPFVGDGMANPEHGVRRLGARPVRHLSRLNTHANLVTAGGYEFEIFYYPANHDWDISYCDFTDGHDGVYVSGRQIRFHHNWVANMQDDGIYLSSPTPYFSDQVHVYANLIATCTAPFGAHGRGGPGGSIHVYRNVLDQRGPVPYNRPTPEQPGGIIGYGTNAFLTHGTAICMESFYFYHNTVLQPVFHGHGQFAGNFLANTRPEATRRGYNNLFVYFANPLDSYSTHADYPLFNSRGFAGDIAFDGDLHWHLQRGDQIPANYLDSMRNDPLSLAAKASGKAPDGWAAHNLAADPKFRRFQWDWQTDNDYRPVADSPAVRAGVVLPPELEDPLRPADGQRPDIGALPHDQEPFRVGRQARIVPGSAAGLAHFPK